MESITTSPRATQSDGSATTHTADAPVFSDSVSGQSGNPTAVFDRSSADQTKGVCDLAEGHAFYPDYNTPPVPVLTAFGSGRLHQCRAEGSWDLERAIVEDAHNLIRSFRTVRFKNNFGEWDDLIFKFGPRAFLCVDAHRIVGYAATAAQAESQVTEFTRRYWVPPKPSGGSFRLITIRRQDIGTEIVPLDVATVLSDESLDLYYRAGFAEWHRDFSRKLRDSSYGLCIVEGTPGTGKTSYLRHLMGTLKESHRFYFIPTSSMSVLSDPNLIEFWSGQRRAHPDRKFVVVLEDSDAALMTRDSDNREQVSAILNLSDGMLADFLRLQIICTINCTTADIDPALLRPGRLLCHRVFGRLDYSEASRLAKYLGRTLPAARDYSLAEVFAGHETKDASRPHIGFAA